MARSVFNFESEDRVESPERLNEYIRVANPGVWVLVSALVLVLVAFVAWGFIGRIPETVTLKGVVDETLNYHIDVLVDPSQYSAKSLVGKEVVFTFPSGIRGRGKVVNATSTPFSREEMSAMLESDFLTSSLVTSDYSNVLDVEPDADLSEHGLEIGQVTIITNEVPPITFLFH